MAYSKFHEKFSKWYEKAAELNRRERVISERLEAGVSRRVLAKLLVELWKIRERVREHLDLGRKLGVILEINPRKA